MSGGFRTVWISDTHLGTRSCKADDLLAFLEQLQTDTLFLVGDIIDLWKLEMGGRLEQTHRLIIRKILDMARNGTRVIYIPGNHDEYFRDYLDMTFEKIEVHRHLLYPLLNRGTALVIHGDEFDWIIHKHRWLARLGTRMYDYLRRFNLAINLVRRNVFGLGYWSLSRYLNNQIDASTLVSNFEIAAVEMARQNNASMVVCGHTHREEFKDIDGIIYANDGDWVEACTYLTEDQTGAIRLRKWSQSS